MIIVFLREKLDTNSESHSICPFILTPMGDPVDLAVLQESFRWVQSQMTDVPDNRTSQMAEFKQIEEVYKIIVFF